MHELSPVKKDASGQAYQGHSIWVRALAVTFLVISVLAILVGFFGCLAEAGYIFSDTFNHILSIGLPNIYLIGGSGVALCCFSAAVLRYSVRPSQIAG